MENSKFKPGDICHVRWSNCPSDVIITKVEKINSDYFYYYYRFIKPIKSSSGKDILYNGKRGSAIFDDLATKISECDIKTFRILYEKH